MADLGIGRDDHAVSRLPVSERKHWFVVFLQRYGQMSALSQFLLGATLGFGMDFWQAFLALTLGAVILEVVAIFTGIAGQREGLSTSMLTRWTGFGRYGSSMLGLIITISLMGWFGVQNAVFAQGLESLLPHALPLWSWEVLTGLAVTGIVIWGFLSMTWTAYIAVPAFVLLCFYSIGKALGKESLGSLVASPHPGPALGIGAGATLVAGGFIVGAVINPDMCRFNRNARDVVVNTILGITLGEYTIGLIGVLLAHFAKTENVIGIVTTTSGAIGVLVLIAATTKINDWNLYSGSLGLANFLDTAFGKRIHRALLTLVVGVIGTLLSALGILAHFIGFLTILGVAFPPVAAIVVVDYFILKTHRAALESSRSSSGLPAWCPNWNAAGWVAWIAAAVVGYYVNWGIASVNSLVVAAILYYGLARLMPVKTPAAIVADA
ncbi:MAG: cytosine permease [Nocardiopsaceae bacterium]|nr:cytosine permease [Nocardiopsaceae bacterium]